MGRIWCGQEDIIFEMISKAKFETIIVGGGPSGLGAANRLYETGKDFLLISDRIGGRMYHSDDFTMNFGATYINDDYKNISKFVGKGLKLKIHEIWSTNGHTLVPFVHWTNIPHFFAFCRMLRVLRKLRKELNLFRKEAEFISQEQLIQKYPLMNQLANQTVPEFVNKYKLNYIHNNYFRYVFLATCFAHPEESNALFYLGTLFPLIIKTYVADYSGSIEKLTGSCKNNIVIDRAISIESKLDGIYWSLNK